MSVKWNKESERTSKQILEHFVPFLHKLKAGLGGTKRKHKKTLSSIQTPKEKTNYFSGKKGSVNSYDKKIRRDAGWLEGRQVPLNKLLVKTHTKSNNSNTTHKELHEINSARIIIKTNKRSIKRPKITSQDNNKNKPSITTPSTPNKQSKGYHTRHDTVFKIKKTNTKPFKHHGRNISEAINDMVEDIMKLKIGCNTDGGNKSEGLERNQLTCRKCPEVEEIKGSGSFLIIKRASAPINESKETGMSSKGKCAKKIKLTNTHNAFFTKTDLFHIKDHSKKTKDLSVHATNLQKYKKLTKKEEEVLQLTNKSLHKFHIRVPSSSDSIPDQTTNALHKKKKITTLIKSFISKTDNPSTTLSKANSILTKKSKGNVMVMPVENVIRLEKEAIASEIIEYIKTYFKEHGEAPKTTKKFYRIGRLLGKGAFGKVSLGMHKLTGKLVAIKAINKEYLTNEASKEKVMKEFSVLKRLRHPNVIRLYESFESRKYILIVMELCTGGDLLNYVREKKKLNENEAKLGLKSLIEGLKHCHSHGVLHRDIKLDNILLNGQGQLKICDFGVSKIIKRGERIFEQCGTPAYIAPEILENKGYEGFAADIWSAGVALYAMLYGTVPFKANSMEELHSQITKGRYSLKKDISATARDLLTGMLECNPYKRITATEIITHKWMEGIQEHISLFTEEEKKTLNQEYDMMEENSLFTEQAIDSTMNDLSKNNTSKSLILAPFNTKQSSEEELTDYKIEDRNIIGFSAKVRDNDRQYEKDNNGEVDNGVYNKFVCESRRSEGDYSVCDISMEIEEEVSYEILERYREDQFPSIAFSSTFKETFIDLNALNQMEAYGYNKDYVKDCLKTNELNHATATYYLLTNYY